MFLPPDPDPASGLTIVGLGYETLGLTPIVKGKECYLLFPYPSLPPGIRRNWDMVRELETLSDHAPIRVPIYDVPSVFDVLQKLTNSGQKYAALAPYGPKTVSLAMCLFAIAYRDSAARPSAFYTQPQVYDPSYSIGVAMDNGIPRVRAYCIKLNGKVLYGVA
jgi:hypothetical protein